MITRIGIIGYGRISKAHVEAIIQNKDKCCLVAISDINLKLIDKTELKGKIEIFDNELEMFEKMKNKMDMVVISTPNNTHCDLAIKSLINGYDVLIEKPVALNKKAALEIDKIAKKFKRKAFAVLQVRYNPSVRFLKKLVDDGILGKIRSVNLIQKWQRHDDYLDKWFGDTNVSGGILYDVGIHYLDIFQWIFGIPEVLTTHFFKLKPNNKKINDTVYSIFKLKNEAAGSIEIGIAAEPYNLECSLMVVGDNGFIKIGGKALSEIERMDFNENIEDDEKNKLKKEVNIIEKRALSNYKKYNSSCPNHPILYRDLLNGKGISIKEASKCIEFIEKINNAG